MKTFLRSFLLLALPALSIGKSGAQCTVSNIVIQNVTGIASTSTSCTIKFDESFNIQNNSGNKFIFIHAWLQNDYPDYFHCVDGQTTLNGSIQAPIASDLGNTYFTIGFNTEDATPTILTTYPPDTTVPMASMDSVRRTVLADGTSDYTLYGVVATAPGTCGAPAVIVADLWSSQSSDAQRAHCVNCGIRYSSGYLSATGLVNCFSQSYAGSITNNTSITLEGYYRVFADINGDGYLTSYSDTLLQDNTPFTVEPNGNISISGPVPGANLNQNVFIVFTQMTGSASGASRVILFRSTQCGALPVTFRSLTASRTSPSNVLLRWETVTEINNRGFAIQRNMGNNSWDQVNFITTQAPGGNSISPLTYTSNDLNSNNGITQYRIKQEDLDGKARFSEIRAVRGNAQNGKIIVYPNPSVDGHVNIVFEDQEGIRDITLADMNGHIVRQWKWITNNTLQIVNLRSGIYILKIVLRETGNQSMERIIVF